MKFLVFVMFLPVFLSCVVRADEIGEELTAGWKRPYKQSFSLNALGLELSGVFPANATHAFEIKGFDNLNRPYSVNIATTDQGREIFKVVYHLLRDGKKESGSIVVKKSQLGRLSSKSKDTIEQAVTFETKVTE